MATVTCSQRFTDQETSLVSQFVSFSEMFYKLTWTSKVSCSFMGFMCQVIKFSVLLAEVFILSVPHSAVGKWTLNCMTGFKS